MRNVRWDVHLAILSALAHLFPYPVEEHVILVVDASATMQTVMDDQGTRMDEARHRARRVIASLPEGSVISIVEVGAFPRVLLRATGDRSLAAATLDDIRAMDVDGDLLEAVRFAQSLRSGQQHARIVCISDLVGSETPSAGVPETDMVIEQVGVNSPNAGVVAMTQNDDRASLDLTLGQQGFPGRQAVVVVTSGSQELARQAVVLSADLMHVRVPLSLSAGSPFQVRLEPSDLLALDNVVCGVWPDLRPLRIELVTNGNRELELAIRADPTAELRVTPLQDWSGAGSMDVVILDGVMPDMQRTPGRYLVFGQTALLPGTSTPTGGYQPTFWSIDHQAVRNTHPMLWGIRRVARTSSPAGARVLVSAQHVPLAYELDGPPPAGAAAGRSSSTAVVFNFHLQDSDLPLRPTFLALLWDTIDYLAAADQLANTLMQQTASPQAAAGAADA